MTLTAIQTNELGKMMREHITCILRMEAVQMKLDWTEVFSPEQILSCCDKMPACLGSGEDLPSNVQRELIQNPQFMSWLAGLLTLIQEETADKEEVERQAHSRRLLNRLADLLDACWSAEKTITSYSNADVLCALGHGLSESAQLAYLENFTSKALSDGERAQILKNLSACETMPIGLGSEQRTLMAQPFVGTRRLFVLSDFEAVSTLFQFCPALTDIAQLLHQKGIDEHLDLTNYQYFAEDGAEYLRLLTLVLQGLDTKAAGDFIWMWQHNNCALSELQRMERRVQSANVKNWDAALSSYAGYVNLLYGEKFKTISLAGLTDAQEALLTYAITHEKKHFIQLVDENADKFLGLSHWSILFCETLYRDHFNLNELTVRDLDDCRWMEAKKLPKGLLAGSRQYTFPELKLLYDAPQAYITLYGKLCTPRLDDRIKVLRQLRKRDVLSEITSEAELTALAGQLDQKPLHDWRREDFGRIRDIEPGDIAQMLVHLDKLRPLLPGIQCRADAMLALRSLEHIDQFDSMDTLKANLLEMDQDWKALADAMELGPDFKARHQEDIVKFLCRDGAGIAQTYLDCLDQKLHPAFHRVVKAELMGQFSDLKYHTGDLEQELDYPLDTQAKVEWRQNLTQMQGNLEVREQDDFFSTMLLGTQPYSTCLSYRDGSYCSCLLACFDSSKKVLYAERDGRIVGRACIRLTKCCVNGAPKSRKGPVGGFNFVDLEQVNGSPEKQHQGERLALFLEHPYISGVNQEERLQVEALFVRLARQKAEVLGAMLVLSLDYREAVKEGFAQTRLYLYISASKAGGQYLDSLGGKAEASSEGSYKENNFLMEQPKSLPGEPEIAVDT